MPRKSEPEPRVLASPKYALGDLVYVATGQSHAIKGEVQSIDPKMKDGEYIYTIKKKFAFAPDTNEATGAGKKGKGQANSWTTVSGTVKSKEKHIAKWNGK